MTTKASRLKFKLSSTAAAVPTGLLAGEPAINTTDRKLYSSDGSNTFQVAPSVADFDAHRHILASNGKNVSEIQRVINTASDIGRSVKINNGSYALSAPLVTGSAAIRAEGDGPWATRLVSGTTDQDLWQHGLPSGAAYYAPLELENLSFHSAGSIGYAIDAVLNKSSGYLRLQNIAWHNFTAGQGFKRYLRCIGASNSSFKMLRAFGSVYGTKAQRASGTQIGCEFISNNNADKSYIYLFEDLVIEAEQHALLFNVLGAPGDSGSLEGVIIDKANGRTNIGHWLKQRIPNSQGVWRPPFWSIKNSNWQGSGGWLSFDGASCITVSDSDIYCDAALDFDGNADVATNAGKTPALNTLEFNYSKNINVSKLEINIFAGSTMNSLLSFSNCDNIVIDELTINYPTSGVTPVINGGIYIGSECTNVSIGRIIWKNWPAGVPKIRDQAGNDYRPVGLVTGRNGGARPKVTLTGQEADQSIGVEAVGGGSVFLTARTVDVLEAVANTSAVNKVKITAQSTGNPALISALSGTDANVELALLGKGTSGASLRDGSGNLRVQVNSTGVAFNAAAPIGKQTLPAAATDTTTTQALVNAIRTILIAYGLAQ